VSTTLFAGSVLTLDDVAVALILHAFFINGFPKQLPLLAFDSMFAARLHKVGFVPGGGRFNVWHFLHLGP
jgi:hypothetical protein